MRLLYVVTEDWYFLSHRLPMARAARDAGFEVHVATRVVDGGPAIRAEGFTLHPVPFVRGRVSPLGTLATIRALRQVHRAVEPAIVHHVALQAAVLGSIAALGPPGAGRQRADRPRLHIHLEQHQGGAASAGPERTASGCCSTGPARPCWCRTPTTAPACCRSASRRTVSG